LRAQIAKLYHTVIRGRVSRSTLADNNEVHDQWIHAEFAQRLYRTRTLCRRALGRQLEGDRLCARQYDHRFVSEMIAP